MPTSFVFTTFVTAARRLVKKMTWKILNILLRSPKRHPPQAAKFNNHVNFPNMYTLDEIDEKAKSAAIKTACLVFVFVILLPVLLPLFMFLMGEKVYLFPLDEHIKGYLYSIMQLTLTTAVFLALASYIITSYKTKKKLEEENEQEENEKREEHYRRMEELLEKMSKDK